LESVPDLEANEAWLAEYLNDAEMQLSPDDLYASLESRPLIFPLWLITQNNLTILLFELGIFLEPMMCILMLQVDYIVFYTLTYQYYIIFDCFFRGLNFIHESLFLLQSYVTSHHRMNRMWYRSLSLDPLKMLSSKV
jgi:hypothetical protein